MPGHVRAWVTADRPARDPFSILIGDCLQNLRSALDHLALELASAFTIPMTDEIEKNSAFPILSDVDKNGSFGVGPSKWSSALASEIRGIDPDAQAEIERLQPYQRGKAYELDPLWRLNTLNNADKHRALHVAVNHSLGPALHVTPTNRQAIQRAIGEGGFKGSIEVVHGNVDGRTYVGAWPAGTTPEGKKMSAAYGPALRFTFEESVPLVGGEPVYDTLRSLYEYVIADVLPKLVGFLH